MQISVVIPLYNEKDSLIELHEKIISNLENFLIDYEIIFIDDGSIDSSWSVIKNLCSSSKKTKGVQFLTNYGKSMALSEGFKLAKGKIVIIGVGGVDTGQSAFEKISAGARAVQLYTGMVYKGPGVVKDMKKELISILKKGG